MRLTDKNNQQGMALVTVILLTACIMTMASMLHFKVMRSSQSSATHGLHNKTYYAANAGVEHARKLLSDTYVSSNYWQNYLDNDPAVANSTPADTFLNVAALSFGTLGTTPPVAVDLHIKDNNDGDDNYDRDNDLRVVVLAQAGRGDTQSMIEATILFDASGASSYSQVGGGAKKRNFKDVSGVDNIGSAGASAEEIILQ